MMEGVSISDDIVGQVTESFSGGIQSQIWMIKSMSCRICGTALVDRSGRLMGDNKSIRAVSAPKVAEQIALK